MRGRCILVNMDYDKVIFVVLIFGGLGLFLFPEPESNFLWYVLSVLGVGGVGGLLVWLRKKS